MFYLNDFSSSRQNTRNAHISARTLHIITFILYTRVNRKVAARICIRFAYLESRADFSSVMQSRWRLLTFIGVTESVSVWTHWFPFEFAIVHPNGWICSGFVDVRVFKKILSFTFRSYYMGYFSCVRSCRDRYCKRYFLLNYLCPQLGVSGLDFRTPCFE